jgi:N-acetylmuramoyl-L-alanine amidase CwlD
MRKTFGALTLFLFLFFVPLTQTYAQEPAPAYLEKIEFETLADFDRVVIQTSSSAEARVFDLREPFRIVVDIQNCVLKGEKRTLKAYSERVERLRVAQFEARPYVTRVVVDLFETEPYFLEQKDNLVILNIGKARTEQETKEEDWIKLRLAKEEESVKEETLGQSKYFEIEPQRVIRLPKLSTLEAFGIYLLGEEFKLEDKIFEHGALMVPLKDLMDALQLSIRFEPQTKTIYASESELIKFEIPVGKDSIKVNDKERKLSAPVSIIDNRVQVPLFPMLKWLGYGIYWDETLKSVFIGPRLTEIKPYTSDGIFGVAIQSSHLIKPGAAAYLEKPDRIVLNFENLILDVTAESISIDRAGIKGVRVSQFKGNSVRLVVDLDKKLPYLVSQIEEERMNVLSFPPVIENILYTLEDQDVLLKIMSTHPISAEVFALKEPNRIIVDIADAVFLAPILTEIESGNVIRVRASQFKDHPLVSRVVVDLLQETHYKLLQGEDLHQLTLKIKGPVGLKARLIAQKLKYFKGRIIVVNPGHGGSDPGAKSLSGRFEKEFTLDTALRLNRLLSDRGATVLMTRDTDSDASLKETVKFANHNRADIFISVHYNAFEKNNLSGTETYYYNENSKDLAGVIHGKMIEKLGRADRGLRRVEFYVVKNTEMPSVLTEAAYLTNPDEEQLILSEGFRQQVAEAIFEGVREYLAK